MLWCYHRVHVCVCLSVWMATLTYSLFVKYEYERRSLSAWSLPLSIQAKKIISVVCVWGTHSFRVTKTPVTKTERETWGSCSIPYLWSTYPSHLFTGWTAGCFRRVFFPLCVCLFVYVKPFQPSFGIQRYTNIHCSRVSGFPLLFLYQSFQCKHTHTSIAR